jgi:type VI secretion system protein ImpJ
MSQSYPQRVLWTEGLLLTPQHFQQQERYFEYCMHRRCCVSQPYYWGVQSMKFSKEMLQAGKLRLLSCTAIFPNGVYYDAPDVDALPNDIEITIFKENINIALMINKTEKNGYIPLKKQVENSMDSQSASISMVMGKLHPKMRLIEPNDLNETCLPIARVEALRSFGEIILSKHFVPPCLNYHIVSIHEWVHSLSLVIKKHLQYYFQQSSNQSDAHLSNEVNEAPWVLVLSRLYGRLCMMQHELRVHPYSLYCILVECLCQLTVYSDDHIFEPTPYQHNDLGELFHLIIKDFFKTLDHFMHHHIHEYVMTRREKNLWISEQPINFSCALNTWIIDIKANASVEKIHRLLEHIKIAPKDSMGDLVRHSLSGMPIKNLNTLPKGLVRDKQSVYALLTIKDNKQKNIQPLAVYLYAPLDGMRFKLWEIQ